MAGILTGVSVCAFAKNVDLSQWTEYRVGLSSLELLFRVPGGDVPAEMPEPAPILHVDLDRDVTDEKLGVGVFWRTWSYRGFFWQGVAGYLRMTVVVRSAPADIRGHLTVPADLETILRRRLDQVYRQHNDARVAEGKSELVVPLPNDYRRITIKGRPWLSYSLRGWKDSIEYATGLTGNRYVVVGFDFIHGAGSKKSTWRDDAQGVADEIATSLDLHEGR